jgi:cytochrome c-type biogenesis protein CcmH/NrfF
MLIGTERYLDTFTRTRNGKKETVKTIGTKYILRCNSCNIEFKRTSKEYKRGSDTHYCKDCYNKNLAQSKSALARKINNYVEKIDASSSKPLGSFTIK